jgi:hypothetical protein
MTCKFDIKKNKYIILIVIVGVTILATSKLQASNNISYQSQYTTKVADFEPPVISNIYHSPSVLTNDDSLTINCNVTDNMYGVDVKLNYGVNGQGFSNRTMINVAGSWFRTTIGPYNVGDVISYAIIATDQSANENTAIDDNSGQYYNVTVYQNDTGGPTISNLAVNPQQPYVGAEVNITCFVTDDYSGIDYVALIYRINSGSWLEVNFTKISGHNYGVIIGPFAANDLVEYYIIALDDSINHNLGIYNNSGSYYSFTVSQQSPGVSLYTIIPVVALVTMSIIYKKKK